MNHMPFEVDDGGRALAGYKGSAGDCVCRAIAIAAEMPYEEIYERLASGAGTERRTKGRSARNGIRVKRKWFKDFMEAIGFEWTPTMQIGSGCKVHLVKGELPMGRLVVSVSRHYTAVIDGVVHDTHDPQRRTVWYKTGAAVRSGETVDHISERCVYGYWRRTT